jgi:hypothetical protein
MKKLTIFLVLLTLISCKVASVDSKRDKLMILERKGWTFYLNSEKIKLQQIILDKQNFKSVDIQRSEKRIYISQKEQNPIYTNIKSIAHQDSLSINDLVVIDGIPYSNLDAKSLKIESSAIMKVTKSTDTIKIGCRPIKNLILISVK